MSSTRRGFLNGGAVAGALAPAAVAGWAQSRPSDRVNVAVVGLHGRGRAHVAAFSKIPGVRIAGICDVDTRLLAPMAARIEKQTDVKPAVYEDIRKMLEVPEIDAISIATPDYWHALMTIWGCQAKKDVYVEKPVSFTVVEGRRMVEAARKYRRVVQSGLDMRSVPRIRSAMGMLHAGKVGKIYRARVDITKPRGSIGRTKVAQPPQGVNWDLYLGPTAKQDFTMNRFHYGWHFFWDMSTGDLGNSGVHNLDAARWGMNKMAHPVKVHSSGGYYAWESDQQTPNFQTATFEYADGAIIDATITNLYSPPSDAWNVFYGTEGYLTSAGGWKAMRGALKPRTETDQPDLGESENATKASFPKSEYLEVQQEAGPESGENHFENFISCVRTRRVEKLNCDIVEGHMSAALCHVANISYKLGRKLQFDPVTETFVGDEEANRLLTRTYRPPFELPDIV